MEHRTCENCCFREKDICLRFSKRINVYIQNKPTPKATILIIEKDWVCNKFEEAISKKAVDELNRQLEKDY